MRVNNPRIFASTVAITAWRRPFSDGSGEADLHVDAVFAEKGRVGRASDPVRFRLSLKRATISVKLDLAGILKVKGDSIRRSKVNLSRSHKSIAVNQEAEASGMAEISAVGAKASGRVGGHAKAVFTETFDSTQEAGPIIVTHWPTDIGCAFHLTPNGGQALSGAPWDPSEKLLTLRDQKFTRQRGEPPEVLVELRCAREDLLIEDIVILDSSLSPWERLTRNKQIVVEQYIREEIIRLGIECGDLSHAFTELVLADVSPEVMREPI